MLNVETLVRNKLIGPIWDGESAKVYWGGEEVSLADFLMSFSKIKDLWIKITCLENANEANGSNISWTTRIIAKELVDYVGHLRNENAYNEACQVYLELARLADLDKIENGHIKEMKKRLNKLYDFLHFDELFRQSKNFSKVSRDEAYAH